MILSLIIYAESWSTDNLGEYALFILLMKPIFSIIPLLTFAIAYICNDDKMGWIKSPIFSMCLAVLGLIIFKLVVSSSLSIAITAESTNDELSEDDGPEIFAFDSWPDFFIGWFVPVLSAGIGALLSKSHNLFKVNLNEDKNVNVSKEKVQKTFAPSIDKVGRISPDGYEWIDLEDGTQWFRINGSGVPYEKYINN
tara:strand:+ start:366 stop:953 length:588 start_codon:yes stop_codon:yes gene_type:complete